MVRGEEKGEMGERELRKGRGMVEFDTHDRIYR